MLNIIIGHRGTGKSHWLKLLKSFYKNKVLFFDLDQEIEKSSKKNIKQLFKKNEKTFREWEKKFLKIL